MATSARDLLGLLSDDDDDGAFGRLTERVLSSSPRSEVAAKPTMSEADSAESPLHDKSHKAILGNPASSIWSLYLTPVLEQLQEAVRKNSLLPIFLLENPYSDYAQQVGEHLLSGLKDYKIINYDETGETEKLARLVTRFANDPPAGVVLVCTSRNQIPREYRSLVRTDGFLTVPKLCMSRLEDYRQQYRVETQAFQLGDQEWIPLLSPQDLLVAHTLSDAHWTAGLRQIVAQKHAIQSQGRVKTLNDVYGARHAKLWAEQLLNDIGQAMSGSIDWDDVDRGALLVGPPGTGKTTIAKAIANYANVSFFPVSPVKDWMSGEGLGESIRNMAATFASARQQAPSIVFIDEIDSIGSREKFTGQNASWNTAFLDALLTELDGFVDRGQVIVIGATNNVDDVDPALRRAGRLDRTIRVERPGLAELNDIYVGCLANIEHNLNAEDINECASSSLGLTAADIDVLVRGARRRARRGGLRRKIEKNDLLDEIYSIPPTADRKPTPPDSLNNTAYHEAGHALVGLLIPSLNMRIRRASIVPNNEGALGFVALSHTDDEETRESLLDRICMALSGRAAEEVVFGTSGVTTGAGGGKGSDLEIASRFANAYLGIYGFSDLQPNCWRLNVETAEISSLLKDQYDRSISLIQGNRFKLECIASKLKELSTLDAEELRSAMGVVP